MELFMTLRALLVLAFLGPAPVAAQSRGDAGAGVVEQLEAAAATGNTEAILALVLTSEVPGLRQFAALAAPAPTRVIIKERDRVALESSGERLLLEVFSEPG